MANNSKFTGWSGKTNFLGGEALKLSNLNYNGRPQNTPQQNSNIITGPIPTDENRVRKSKITPGVKQPPIERVIPSPNPDFSKATKLGAPTKLSSTVGLQSVSLPFTAGTIDTSFPYGIDNGFDGDVNAIKVQPDGKILVGGNFSNYDYNNNTYYSPYFIRLNSDGTPDTQFLYTLSADNNGWALDDEVTTIDLQSDGKILIGGDFIYYNEDISILSPRIMRFNSDGTFDDTFFVGDGFNDFVNKIVVQSDDKILVGGLFFRYNSVDNWRIIRLHPDGNADLSFVTGDGINWDDYGEVYDIVVQSDGKIILGGDFYNYNGNNANYIVRLNTNGSYDNTFASGSGFNDPVYALALQSDDKIIVGGEFNVYNNINLNYGYIIRLGVNGEIDTKFGNGLNNTVRSLYVQSDDKILVGGYMAEYYPNNFTTVIIDELVRFHSDCTLDYSFAFNNILNSAVFAIDLDSDNKIYIGGVFFEDGEPFLLNRFGKLNNTILEYPYVYSMVSCSQPLLNELVVYVVGSMTPLDVDLTYSLQSIQNPSITVCGFIELDIYPSNIVGYTSIDSYNNCNNAILSTSKLVTVRDCLNPLGNAFDFFADSKYQVGDVIYVDFIMNDFFNVLGNENVNDIVYFKYAGTIVDETVNFDPEFAEVLPKINYVPYTTCEEAIESNGVHYVTLSCTEEEVQFPLIHTPYFDSVTLLLPTADNPVKFLVDYLPYDNYNLISGGTPEVFSTIKLGDGEDCISGLTKFAPEGQIDYSFNEGGFNGGQNGPLVYTTVEQPDGKILVGGNFDDYDGVEVGNFMRLTSEGFIDQTFYLGLFDSYVRAIALQPDGKILVGGNFTNYDGYNCGRIIRLNSDGTIDSNFTFNTEFDGIVRAIALQKDGKIVVGGGFDYYYDFYCPQIVRLNSDGTPDPTFVMGDGFDGDDVFNISIESIRNEPFYNTNGPITYTENIIVGGWFNWYNGTTVKGVVKLSPTGEVLPDFGVGLNQNTGGTPRVNQVLMQPDGKVVIIGGADGGELRDFNGTWIPNNIVRLVKDTNGIYQIDTTFTTRDWDNTGGFNNGVLSITLLPNGKYMVGGEFNYYGDNNDITVDIPYLVRLNSDGTLDKTFTFELTEDNPIKTMLLSSGKLLVGGRFNAPREYLLSLCIGEEYQLRSFTTCDGVVSNIYTSIDYQPETLLDLVYDGDFDDDNFFIKLPLDFDVNFLDINYTSVYIGSNSYLTFGAGADNHDFSIPSEIESNGPGLPGVYISTRQYLDGNTGCLDSAMWKLYTGKTDNGNTTIIRFEGNDDYQADQGDTNLVYNFKFYRDQSNYFDLIIEKNEYFCNDDSTGGTSDGSNSYLDTFDSSPENSYRIFNNGTIDILEYSPVLNTKSIKANLNDRVTVCGSVGDVITVPNSSGTIGGSLYFDGLNDTMVQVNNGDGQFGFGGGNDFTIEWFQYFEGGTNARPFSIGVYSSPSAMIGMSFEGTVYLWIDNTAIDTTIVNDDLLNGWHHIAITRNYDGSDRTWRVFLDGVEKISVVNNTDTSNTYTLTLGNQLNNDGKFQGYITSFRVNNLTALYTSNFEVPTSPLTCVVTNTILSVIASSESTFINDSCNIQATSSLGVTWSSNTPFVNLNEFSLFNLTNEKTYKDCTECGQTYRTKLFVRDGVNPNSVVTYRMTLNSINNVLTNGPIFTTRGPECYEILKYTY